MRIISKYNFDCVLLVCCKGTKILIKLFFQIGIPCGVLKNFSPQTSRNQGDLLGF